MKAKGVLGKIVSYVDTFIKGAVEWLTFLKVINLYLKLNDYYYQCNKMTENEILELKSRFNSSEMFNLTSSDSISLGSELIDFLGGSVMSLTDLLSQGLPPLAHACRV